MDDSFGYIHPFLKMMFFRPGMEIDLRWSFLPRFNSQAPMIYMSCNFKNNYCCWIFT